MANTSFPALSGFYQLLFLYLEPTSEVLPALMSWFFPGAAWFHHQLIPTEAPVPAAPLDPRTLMMTWQLGNCYLLLGLVSSFVFRAARDALKHDLPAQERVVGSLLTALAIADLSHIAVTLIGLPASLRMDLLQYNSMAHGNITVVVVLFSVRMAWFLGVGRTSYWYTAPKVTKTE
ncbi:hypothetical protein HMN09_00584500 [Mycena chlorophos]|uniref:DUF7704 domain-containing protein n=1 Tax=Mycena chlorophos TaxID=658473 RepID=A0A8H6T3Y4_MYCCL|nr:hypothetical protein HMN09_00584500 [Mycena chlorophos]